MPKEGAQADLENELLSLIKGTHPLTETISERPDIIIIRKMLKIFNEKRGGDFDLRNGSIGNFFFVGGYFLFDNNLEAPLYLYQQLAGVKGQIIPATLENVHLGAELKNGEKIWGQSRISHSPHNSAIEKLFYYDNQQPKTPLEPKANPKAIEAIKTADLLVYSIGSFYTSILSILHLKGIAEAIRESKAPKIFIANPTEDWEIPNLSIGSMAAEIIRVLKENDSLPGEATDYLEFVIANDFSSAPIAGNLKGVNEDVGNLNLSIPVLKFPLIKDANRGLYKTTLLTKILFSFIPAKIQTFSF